MEQELENKKEKMDKFFTLVWCLVEVRREKSEELMTVGWPDSPVLSTALLIQRTGAGSQPRPAQLQRHSSL